MNIVVTGATGYIGSALCAFLVQHPPVWGETVRVIASGRNTDQGARLRDLGVEFVAGDVCDAQYCDRLTDGADVVVHCAGVNSVGAQASAFRPNIIGTRNMAHAAEDAGVTTFVNLGSPSMHFDFNDHAACTEDYIPARFADPYAASKAWAEHELLHSEGAMNIVSLRPRFVSGYGDEHILGRFVRLHMAGKLVQIGDGSNLVDFTHVDNLVELIAMLLSPELSAKARGKAFVVTNGQSIRLYELLGQVFDALGLPALERRVPYPVAYAGAWASELAGRMRGQPPAINRLGVAVMRKTMTFDIAKAISILGYTPRKTNDDIVEDFCRYWRDHHKENNG